MRGRWTAGLRDDSSEPSCAIVDAAAADAAPRCVSRAPLPLTLCTGCCVGCLLCLFCCKAQFWNGATADSSFNAIQAQMGKVLVGAGLVSQAAYDAGMADDNINEATRVSWKFACSKTVLGTPTFFVNGVQVNGDPSWTLADWRSMLDPLLQPQPSATKIAAIQKHACKKQRAAHLRRFVKAPQTCPVGEPTCTYAPGKTECCFAGEMCIPNVGCRC